MVFSIRQFSTLPTLKMRLYRDGRNTYKNFDDMIENSVITFAMRDEKTGVYKVANREAKLALREPVSGNTRKEYYIIYNFTPEDTETPGIYIGEFKIIFIDSELKPTGELIVPIGEQLYIHVLDSFVKSDIFYIN